jgi:hypothetical protein
MDTPSLLGHLARGRESQSPIRNAMPILRRN